MMKRFIAMLTSCMIAVPTMFSMTAQAGLNGVDTTPTAQLDETWNSTAEWSQSNISNNEVPLQSGASAFSGHGTDLERYGTDEIYAIIPTHAGSCSIDVDAGNKTSLQIWQTHRRSNQEYKLIKNGDYYYIQSQYEGKVVQLAGAKYSGQYPWLEVATQTGTDKQLWSLVYMGDGTYMIRSKEQPDKFWDVYGGRFANGTALMAFSENCSHAQRFRFVHVSTVEPIEEWGATRTDCNGSDWDIWDGSKELNWYYGHKNDKDLYIDSCAAFHGLAVLINSGNSFAGKTIHLTRDLNLAGIGWTPIGNSSNWFQGSFDGGGHAIVGLSLTDTSEGADWHGLFGCAKYGSIGNFAVKGSVAGDEGVGGVVGCLDLAHLYNVYSEVTMTRATDDYLGGLVGYAHYASYIEHCTQNARVTSGDCDPYRGGIVGCTRGVVRYCKNMQTVDCDWNYVGGIAGGLDGGKIEYCANYGMVGCAADSKHAGGIVGYSTGGSMIFSCYNSGRVYSTGAGYIGGICGDYETGLAIEFCINEGSVSGNYDVGGIVGKGQCLSCLNLGIVSGKSEVGAISGYTPYGLDNCLALSWSSPKLNGKGSDNGAAWINADALVKGEGCYKLNGGSGKPIKGWNNYRDPFIPFYQNLGSDPIPRFTGSEVHKGYDYYNDAYNVDITWQKGFGYVEVDGSYRFQDGVMYRSGFVDLKAFPAAGCEFDHYEITTSKTGNWTRWDGNTGDYPTVDVKTYPNTELRLTNSIDRCYSVKAVFKVFDDTPDDLKITAKVELKCTNSVGGWNSDIIPVYLVDSAGNQYLWEISRSNLDDEGETQTHEFKLGAASPVALYAHPDFGGGMTMRELGLQAKMWVNGSGEAVSSESVTISSWPFISSKYGDDYMHISFMDSGISKIGVKRSDGTVEYYSKKYTSCKDAWQTALNKGNDTVIQLQGAWLVENAMELSGNKTVTIDLNGFPIIRSIKKTTDDGELFKINSGSTLNFIDSFTTRKTASTFTGGSVQGGRSDNSGGLIECAGTLNMNGGTLYNGGTTDKGGALRLTGSGTANLTNVLISDCWTDKAVFYDNDGGAIYMRDNGAANLKNVTIRNCRAHDHGGAIYLEDDGNRLNCENVDVKTCKTNDNEGAGVYQDAGATNWVGGSFKNCKAESDDGGALYQNKGDLYQQNITFENNYTEDSGGVLYSNTDDNTWFIGCTMKGNVADDHGGAIYMNDNYLYMADCTIMGNAAAGDAGGVYLDSSGSVDLAGKIVIKNNDGAGSMDNLIIEEGASLYDNGIAPDSDIHLRSYSDGDVYIGNGQLSEYKLKNWFHADYGKLELADAKQQNTRLSASVFTDDTRVLYVVAAVLVLFTAGGLVYIRRKKGVKK